MKLRNKKTGESGELQYYPDKAYHFAVSAKDPTQTGIYKTLGELLQDWTDFAVHVPTEPLIKDEKARKIVRAWAEYNNTESVYAYNLTYDHGGVCIKNQLVRFYDPLLRTDIDVWFHKKH